MMSIKFQTNISKQTRNNLERIAKMRKGSGIDRVEKQLEKMAKIRSMPVIGLALEMAKIMERTRVFDGLNLDRIYTSHEKVFKEILENKKLLSRNIRFKQIQELAQDIQSKISPIVNIPALELVSSHQSILNTIPKIDFDDFKGYQSRKHIENEIQGLDAKSFNELTNYFDEKIDNSPKGSIPAQGLAAKLDRVVTYLMFFLMFASFIQNRKTGVQKEIIISQQKQTNEYLQSIEKFANKVYPKIEKLANQGKEEHLIIVIKNSTLRLKPSSNSDSVATVYSNQLLNIIKDQKKWFYVKYFDHKESITKMGWIYKGNVRKYTHEN